MLKENLTRLMKERGVTINVLSDSTGISIPKLKRLRTIENTNPTLDNLVKLSQFFTLSIDELTNLSKVIEGSFKVPFLNYDEIPKYILSNHCRIKRMTIQENIKGVSFCFMILEPMFSFNADCIFFCSTDFKVKDGDFCITMDGKLCRIILNGDIMIAFSATQSSNIITFKQLYAKVIKVKYERHYE